MFEYLKKFRYVYITGPQRSGTRICSHMVAHDTGFEFIDENKYKYDNLCKLIEILNNKSSIIIHGPAIVNNISSLVTDKDAVIFMRRNIADISASEKRIKWSEYGSERIERAKFPTCENKTIAEIKYTYWDKVKHTFNAFDIEYESLKSHILWIPKEFRKNFDSHQWKL
jgi:hypothetical protein